MQPISNIANRLWQRLRWRRLPLTIAILSFNRPEYLREVLASISPQLWPGDEVLLFQDGGWDRFAQQSLAREEDIQACLAIFDAFFPRKRKSRLRTGKFTSRINFGIAGNYRRAEAHIFETLQRDSAVFLEDDLVLGPRYLFSISKLLTLAEKEPKIGYVAAYGDFWANLVQQRARAADLTPMHENWGAALNRRSWLAQKPVRERYWNLIKDRSYTARDHQAIYKFYRDLGYHCEISSQDASRWIACCVAGLARLTTSVCQARYIGVTGIHSTPEYYARHRFADAKIFPDGPTIQAPSRRQLDAWIEESRASFREGYVHAYQKSFLAGEV